MAIFYPLLRTINQSLLSGHCYLCLDPVSSQKQLCPHCEESLALNIHCCPICAIPRSSHIAHNLPCPSCQNETSSIERIISPYRYEGSIRFIIQQFKYHSHPELGKLLANLFIRSQKLISDQPLPLPDALIPVPMHPGRQRERGFNHAVIMAKHLAKHYHIPFYPDYLKRIRSTTVQAGLSAKERRKNVSNAFTTGKKVSCKRVVVLDDIVTTGSTVNEIARILLNVGIESVEVWSLARA